MEILEAYDLTRSLRATAALCGVDHHTVHRYVAARAAGLDPTRTIARDKVTDPFADKIIEWIDRSGGKARADVVHRKLEALGYVASERTTRRVVAQLKREYLRQHHRIYKPWIPEPGLWLQFDYGEGPWVGGRRSVLFCAWLAWSRFRVILALSDRTMPSVIGALDATFAILGGAPTYLLTDNERTVTSAHVAGLAVRNRTMLAVANYYGVSVHTCVPADPESKGGSESSVKLAKADVLPRADNLVEHYVDFGALERACDEATERFNTGVHRETNALRPTGSPSSVRTSMPFRSSPTARRGASALGLLVVHDLSRWRSLFGAPPPGGSERLRAPGPRPAGDRGNHRAAAPKKWPGTRSSGVARPRSTTRTTRPGGPNPNAPQGDERTRAGLPRSGRGRPALCGRSSGQRPAGHRGPHG